jgi:hypothetical protein
MRKREKAGALGIPEYQNQSIEGFQVLIAASVLAHNDDPVYQRKPLTALKSELATVAASRPPRALQVLRSVLIGVEWHDADDPDIDTYIAKYFGTGPDPANRVAWSLKHHKHPLKTNNVEIINMAQSLPPGLGKTRNAGPLAQGRMYPRCH